jgi:hypothetical protein
MQAVNWKRDSGLLWASIVGLGLVTVLYRMTPYLLGFNRSTHFLWNFVPVGALGLYAGARLRTRFALLVPLAVMLASDLAIAPFLAEMKYPAFSPLLTPVRYASFILYALLGRFLCQDRNSVLAIGGAALLGSVQFFLLTNFAVWLGDDGTNYPHTLAGLGQAYWMALPFYRSTLGGDLLFTGLFFGVDALARHVSAAAKAEQPA